MATPDDAVQRRTLSIDEAAVVLGINPLLVRKLVATGRIRSSRLGTRIIRLNRDDVLQLAEGEAVRSR